MPRRKSLRSQLYGAVEKWAAARGGRSGGRGPQVELTLYADVTTVQLVHEADLWMVAYTHGGSPGAIDHIDTGTLAGEVGSGANDGDVVAYIESRLRAAGYSVTPSETPDSVVATWEVTPASGEAASAT